MNYKEINESVRSNKLVEIVGWFCLIGGIMIFISTIGTYFETKTQEANYIKAYVYSDSGILYYENNEEKVYVEKIYNTYDETIELNIPDKNTVIMYCDKNNTSDCIYFDEDDILYQNPLVGMFLTLFLIASALICIPKKRFNKILKKNNNKKNENSISISGIYLLFIFFFVSGIAVLGSQIYNAINYYNLKNNNNVTTATIYSQFYSKGADNDTYKPVSYYYVDNQKYIYLDNQFENGNLNDNIGHTFELYYNKNNPNKVTKKENPLDFKLLIIGTFCIAFSFPFIFFKKKMEKRIDKNLSYQEEKEWKI